MRDPNRTGAPGFSTLEVIAGLSVLMFVAGMAVVSMEGARPGIQAGAGLDMVTGQLRLARESAMAQQRSFQVRFNAPDRMQLRRFDVPFGFTDFPAVSMENAVQFTLFAGLPDTPDGFGNANPIAFGGIQTLIFRNDGTLVDSAGVPLDGTVFIGIPGHPETARAVTIQGATGRMRAYHWTGSVWEE